MKIFLLISSLFLSLSSAHATINYNPHENSLESIKNNDFYESAEYFSLSDENFNSMLSDIFKPILSFYVVNFIREIQEDSEKMSEVCNISLETKENQKNFIKCFNKEKENFSNPIFISSTELSTVFLQMDKKDIIRENFINSFTNELSNLKANYSDLAYIAFEKILVDFFSKILLESYQKNILFSSEHNISHADINVYFSDIASKLNKELTKLSYPKNHYK